MKRLITYMLLALLGTTVLTSCSMEVFDADMIGSIPGDGSVVITGSVTDAHTGEALSGMSILFKAYPQARPDAAPISVEEVITTGNGTFSLTTYDTLNESMLCILTASDPENGYESQTKQIIVTWNGTSYDRENNMFVVNDCNFQLTHATASANSLQSL